MAEDESQIVRDWRNEDVRALFDWIKGGMVAKFDCPPPVAHEPAKLA